MADSEIARIIWYSDKFKKRVIEDRDVTDPSIEQFTSGTKISALESNSQFVAEYNDRIYAVWTSVIKNNDVKMYIFYYFDETAQRRRVMRYARSQTCVMLILIDNTDEALKNARESEKAEITGCVEKLLEDWIGTTNGFLKRLENNRFIAVCENQDLKVISENKFMILDKIRQYKYGEITGLTLSIGVGKDGTLAECHEMAKQALDMALGRGGDQAAVKSRDKFEFFGGTSKSVEKHTKVKTRVVATALRELFEGGESIYIMGHRFADFDAFGASVGLYDAAKKLGKDVHIVMSKSKTLAGLLLKRIEEQNMTDTVMEPDEAFELINENSVLVIVDTHRPDFVESPEIYRKAKTVVVIDHHRQTVGHIDNAVIFYHEPAASSASEMVAELMQYMKAPVTITKPVAEALLAGIMLDTKNFVVRTGVRTFEAAAFLRSRGADTVAVKQLFSNSIEDYQLKTSIASNAEVYKKCAIAIAHSASKDLRVVAAQAADELLTINGVEASFVIFGVDNVINISARSMGAINVQVVMEAIGGGGHHSMAATQLKNITISDARVKLLQAIDSVVTDK